tara:strand:- start:2108 stop:2449 length:342 start_codon:yes stop_codon:yes gene_type:complete
MSWKQSLAIIVSFAVVIQFLHWLLGTLGVHDEIGSKFSLFVSANFALLIAIIIFMSEQQKRLNKIESILYRNGYNKKEGVETMNKRGYLDVRVLWVLVGLVILYLLYAAFIAP